MPTHSIAPDTLNATQAADMLFADIETILILARSGELPGAKVGKSWVFLREDVIEFLRGRVRAETGQRKQPVLPDAVLMPRPSRQRRQPPRAAGITHAARRERAAHSKAIDDETPALAYGRLYRVARPDQAGQAYPFTVRTAGPISAALQRSVTKDAVPDPTRASWHTA